MLAAKLRSSSTPPYGNSQNKKTLKTIPLDVLSVGPVVLGGEMNLYLLKHPNTFTHLRQ